MGMERPDKAVILLIELDEDARGELKSALIRRGYSVVGVENEEEALIVTVHGGARPNLILAHMDASVDQTLEMGHRIKRIAELSPSVPIVVVPHAYDPAFGGTAVSAGENDYVYHGTEPTQLEDLVGRLIS